MKCLFVSFLLFFIILSTFVTTAQKRTAKVPRPRGKGPNNRSKLGSTTTSATKIVPPRTQQLPILVKYTNTKQCKVFHGENQQYVNCKNHGIWGSYYWTNDKLDRCLLIESNSKKSPVDMSNCKFIEKPTKFFYSVKKRQCLRLIKEGTSKIYNTMFECRQDIVGLVTVHICNNAQKTVKFVMDQKCDGKFAMCQNLHHEQAIVNAKDHKYESNSDYAYLNCNLEKIHYDHEAQDCRQQDNALNVICPKESVQEFTSEKKYSVYRLKNCMDKKKYLYKISPEDCAANFTHCLSMTKREYKKLGKAKTEQRVSRRLMLNCETEKCTRIGKFDTYCSTVEEWRQFLKSTYPDINVASYPFCNTHNMIYKEVDSCEGQKPCSTYNYWKAKKMINYDQYKLAAQYSKEVLTPLSCSDRVTCDAHVKLAVYSVCGPNTDDKRYKEIDYCAGYRTCKLFPRRQARELLASPKNNMEKMKFVHCYDDKCSSDDDIDERNANAVCDK